jgi:putative intracellular protease/amidase
MNDSITRAATKPLAVLLENEFDAAQIRKLQEIFAIAEIEITFLSYLWGHSVLEFTGDDPNFKIAVSTDVTQVRPTDFSGLLLPGGYAMDRLRYQESPICGQPNHAPAVGFLRQAVAALNEGKLKIGAIGHGLQLFTAAPDILFGRQVTCVHNIINEVSSAGGVVLFVGTQTADLHLDRGLLTARDTSVAPVFFATLASELAAAG